MTLEQLGIVIPVHGELAPVLPLLATLAGPATPDSDRAARVVVVDDAKPAPNRSMPRTSPTGSNCCAGRPTAVSVLP